jgi:hypothetical protein
MHSSRTIRRSSLLLTLSVGLIAPLALAGCGEKVEAPSAAPEDSPNVKAKDSMDFYKKSKNIPANPGKR